MKWVVRRHSCYHGNIHYTYHSVLSEMFASLIVLHIRSNLILLQEYVKIKILDDFKILIT